MAAVVGGNWARCQCEQHSGCIVTSKRHVRSIKGSLGMCHERGELSTLNQSPVDIADSVAENYASDGVLRWISILEV